MKKFLKNFCGKAQKISCLQADENFLNQSVVLSGWVQNQRDHGHFCFIDLKDETGILQIFLDLEQAKKFKISNQSVIAVKGILLKRPAGSENKKLKTGQVELKVTHIQMLSRAETLPIDPDDHQVRDSLKLKYRYLSLRSNKIQTYLKLRDRISQVVRSVLQKENFTEIETPILYKTTPEGARDYLVPSRIHLGQFYSLVQSPQILKQLLMVGGMGRYFQIAKCFRDEDLRSDRQPEFTQIDLEMSFVDVVDVMKLNETLLRELWKQIKNTHISHIQKLSYQQAFEKYGSDKPDLRIPLELKSLDSLAQKLNVQIFKQAVKKGGRIKSLALPKGDQWSRSLIDRLTEEVKKLGAKGLLYLMDKGGPIEAPLPISQEDLKMIYQQAGGQKNSVVLILADQEEVVNQCFSFLISHLAQKFSLIDESQDQFLWITDMPLFAIEEGAIVPLHHPFTAPDFVSDSSSDNETALLEPLSTLTQNPQKVLELNLKAKAYDLVCNGQEIAGGSIRNHQAPIQEALFKALGLSEKSINEQFGFFISALKYGTPPHGGIAWGLDRLVMILAGTQDIRDVMAFPKSLQAMCLMSEAPSPVSEIRLRELGISLKKTLK